MAYGSMVLVQNIITGEDRVYLSVDEASRKLGISKGQIYGAIKRGTPCLGTFCFDYWLDGKKDGRSSTDSMEDAYMQAGDAMDRVRKLEKTVRKMSKKLENMQELIDLLVKTTPIEH